MSVYMNKSVSLYVLIPHEQVILFKQNDKKHLKILKFFNKIIGF